MPDLRFVALMILRATRSAIRHLHIALTRGRSEDDSESILIVA